MGKTQRTMMGLWGASLASILVYAGVGWAVLGQGEEREGALGSWLPMAAAALIAGGLVLRVVWLKPLLVGGRRLTNEADRRRYRHAHFVAYWVVDMAGVGGLVLGLTGGPQESMVNVLAAAFLALVVMWPRTMAEAE